MVMRRIYPQRILGHWDQFIDGLRLPVLDLYAAIEAQIAERGLTQITLSRVTWPERGMLSPQRYYLQVCFQDLVFIICAIPMGHSTYVSWWCGLSERGFTAWLSEGRFLGWLRPILQPMTFYRVDSMRAFERSLHNALMNVLDIKTSAKGVRRLTAFDRTPNFRDLVGS